MAPNLLALGLALLLVGAAARSQQPTAGPLQIEAQGPTEPIGTMHFSTRVSIRWGEAGPLVFPPPSQEPGEGGEGEASAPIFGPQFQLSSDRVLLLGWSSIGAGMQTIHAMLIGRSGRSLEIVDELVYQTDRPSSSILVRRDPTAARIGIFRPDSLVFDEESWRLSARGFNLDVVRIRRLAFSAPGSSESDFLYAPVSRPAATDTRTVAWLQIDRQGFRPPPTRTRRSDPSTPR